MIRAVGAALLLCVATVLPGWQARAHDAVGGAIIGAGTGAIIGGMVTGRADGAIHGAIVGGTAGAILRSEVGKRPGYSWRDGDCYRRVRGGDVRVTRRFCY